MHRRSSYAGVDADQDGYTAETDCDDDDAAIHPGATDVCDDGIDQDCSGRDLACTGDTTAPTLGAGEPSGLLPAGTTQTTLRVTTDEDATCRWSTMPDTPYGAMADTFATTGGTSHETLVTGLADGQSYAYCIRCQDGAGNANAEDFIVSFSVSTDATYTITASAGPNGSISPESFTGDPLFAAPGTKFTPGVGSPLIGKGDTANGSIHDITGKVRFDPPDVGAYEH